MKPLLRALLLFTALVGVVLALWPAGQNLYARRSQAALHRQFAAATKPRLAPGQKKAPQKPHRAAAIVPVQLPPTRITCPQAELDAIVVRGVHPDELRHGPGWMPGTALPGQKGNCVIAGHRNVYGSPFGKLDVLMPGSEITVETAGETYPYLVVQVYSAADNDQSVIAPPTDGSARLTLITCTTPKTAYRLIVSAIRSD